MWHPESGNLKRYRLAPGTGPHNVIADERGAFYAGNLDGHIGLIDPEMFDPETRSLWFGTDSNTIVRASLR